MTKIIVASAPRCGTHMLVRMISRAKKIPWKVPYDLNDINNIKQDSWVIGIHDKYENIVKTCSKETKIICIKRINGHKQSLSKFDQAKNFDIDAIINSFPQHLTVIYDEIIKPNQLEINKINKILETDNIEYEPWEKRYDYFSNWRIKKHDENNPKLV